MDVFRKNSYYYTSSKQLSPRSHRPAGPRPKGSHGAHTCMDSWTSLPTGGLLI